MKFYIGLQIRLLNRQLIEFGIQPFLFYFLAIWGFLGSSLYLFNRVDFAEYIYGVIPLAFMTSFNTRQRNDFLKSISTNQNFYAIRMIENGVICFPFFLFLIFKEAYWVGLVLVLLSSCLSLINLESKFRFVIPTPFYRYPFEFAVGFRKSYLLVVVAYVIGFIGVGVENFSLSLSGLVILIFNCCLFYTKPEPLFFVWVFSMEPGKFIRIKMQTALFYTGLLCLPMTSMLCFFFVDTIHITLLIQLFGLLLVIAGVLGKYTYYPLEMSLLQGIALGISVILPPLLFIIIPLFYYKAIRRLNEILT